MNNHIKQRKAPTDRQEKMVKTLIKTFMIILTLGAGWNFYYVIFGSEKWLNATVMFFCTLSALSMYFALKVHNKMNES